ncbi:MAG: CTP synthase [Patescibacteria group bacterium]|jgi:CTP synthase
MANFIFVTGGVISGLGKGITTSSVSLLLEQSGYTVTALKADPYLNMDAGTMNPIIHGETFVTEDGLETDQDLGHYERFLNKNLSKLNYMTSGMVFQSVIDNERKMAYQGECVEMIRHVPEEISRRLILLANTSKADVVVAEIGGTVGDIQNILFLEAARQLRLMSTHTVLVIHVAYLPFPKNLGELKTKPAQQSVSHLLAAGIQPDFIVTRSEREIDSLRKEKIAIFCNVHKEDIFTNPDLPSVYQVPAYLKKQGIVERIIEKMHLPRKTADKTKEKNWDTFVEKTKSKTKGPLIGIVGKYIKSGDYSLEDSYICVLESLKQAFYYHDLLPRVEWVASDEIEQDGTEVLKKYDGLIVPQGWGSRGTEGKIAAIQFARENNVPYLGLCFGMQMAVIEFARHVLGMKDANSTEVTESTPFPVIHIMPGQAEYLRKKQYGGTIRLGAWPAVLQKGTKLLEIYKKYSNVNYPINDRDSDPVVQERHRHRYEFNEAYLDKFREHGLTASALSPDGKLVEAIELADHPFFIGVQYHPELKSRPLAPHPIFLAFLEATIK